MGACNSSGARAFEQRCARKMRTRDSRSKRRNSTSSSSSSSSSAGAPEASAEKQEQKSARAPLVREQIVEEPSEHKQQLQEQREQKANGPDEAERKRARLARLKEGVDFIETEEDAEAVESAVVKIQSTFRGKKIRSKLGGAASKTAASTSQAQAEESQAPKQERSEEELNKKVATMQVNDNSGGRAEPGAESAAEPAQGSNLAAGANLPEEAERAATKIQAGFKGYKTRKELEGKLAGGNAAAQEAEPAAQK